MKSQLYILKTITGLHCGTGLGDDKTEQPTSRDPVTQHPQAPGSSLKGVLRDHFPKTEEFRAVFGPDRNEVNSNEREPIDAFASCVSFGDARLLCLPVRSFKGTFAYVTCPLALHYFKQAALASGVKNITADLSVPDFPNDQPCALLAQNSCLALPPGQEHSDLSKAVLLEDLLVTTLDDQDRAKLATQWRDNIAELLKGCPAFVTDLFSPRFIIVSNEVLDHFCRLLPTIDRTSIDPDTGVVKKDTGALWSEEILPPEAILYGVLDVSASRTSKKLEEKDALAFLKTHRPATLQLGGKATVGRGWSAFHLVES